MDATSELLLPPPVGQGQPTSRSPSFAFFPNMFHGAGAGHRYRDYVPLATVDTQTNATARADVEAGAGVLPNHDVPSHHNHHEHNRSHHHEPERQTIELITIRIPANFSWKTALIALLWYSRMSLVLTLVCATVVLPCSLVGAFFGALALGAFSPWSSLAFGTAITACVAGAAVIGCVVGLAGFCMLVVRRVRAGQIVPVPAPDPYEVEVGRQKRTQRQTRWCDNANFLGSNGEHEREPLEMSWVLLVGGVASVAAMAVGMMVIPGLTTEAFSLGNAFTMGVVGAVVPMVPFAFSACMCTLLECNAEAGLECCGELCCGSM